MKKSGGVSGAVSLVMIFCVMCLAVFAVLTLVCADRETKLSEIAALNASDYYRADYNATAVVAALKNGSSLPQELDVDIVWNGNTAAFLLPINDSMGLDVAVSIRGGKVEILRWQTVYTGSWEPNLFLDLWDGT